MDFKTQGFNPYSVKYSPFFDNRIAVASAANFGLVGNGRLYVLELTPNGIACLKWYPTQDALYDLAFSETHPSHTVVSSGDGSLRMFNADLEPQFPVGVYHEHAREAFSVSWNLVGKRNFASSSWDGTVKLWDPERPTMTATQTPAEKLPYKAGAGSTGASILTLPIHSCTYSTSWSPHSADILSCVSSDSHLRVFDLRLPASNSNHLAVKMPIHAQPQMTPSPTGLPQPTFPPSEALTHDWNKYRDTVLAVAGVDSIIRIFDIRNPRAGPVSLLQGHQYAVRRVAWSPHISDLLLSASYDMTCRVWTDGSSAAQHNGTAMVPGESGPRELGRNNMHTEFATGVDWCLFGSEGWAASCGWDESVRVWDVRAFMHH